MFGGYNFICFGDWWQLPPIPDTAAVFKPPNASCSRKAKTALNLFWSCDADSLNFLVELTEQKRVTDAWYNDVLMQCRNGDLSDESYYFISGLPTEHSGSWRGNGHSGSPTCGVPRCAELAAEWRIMAMRGASWQDMVALECRACQLERDRRNRLVAPMDPRVKEEPFASAPYIHKNNEPKYHALLLRAMEHAKRGGRTPQHVLWVTADDVPANPAEVEGTEEQVAHKRHRWLQYHDQRTAGIPGLLPLYIGMKARVTEQLSKRLRILKHCPCTVVGWELDPVDTTQHQGSEGTIVAAERLLTKHPRCIYIKFDGATWQLHKHLDAGVYPLRTAKRTWILNQQSQVKVHRRGFTLLPDFASTAHMIQGMTLDAVIADCGAHSDTPSLKDMLAAYVALSRVRQAETLLILRMFAKPLFQQGAPPGPSCLMKFLRSKLHGAPGDYTADDAAQEYAQATEERKERKAVLKREPDWWTCFACTLTHPPEAFGASANSQSQLYYACMAWGHWRACTACSAARHALLACPHMADSGRCCGRCGESKAAAHFPTETDSQQWCRQCELQRQYRRATCRECHKELLQTEFTREQLGSMRGQARDPPRCRKCAPPPQLECTICGKAQDRSEFRTSAVARP